MRRGLIPFFLSILMFGAHAAAPATASRTSAPITAPAATGIAHTCLQYYPSLAKQRGVQGNTIVHFIIGEDGAVRDPEVKNSSGSDLLDQASIDCVNKWTYQAAKQNGNPIAVSWNVEIKWFLYEDFEGPAEEETPPPGANWVRPVAVPGTLHGCQVSYNSLTDHLAPSGQSGLSFTITPDGTTRDVVITRTSGSAIYDKTAVECVQSWRYIPATHDGVPASEHWIVRVEWHDPMQNKAP